MTGYQGIDLSGGDITIIDGEKVATVRGKANTDKVIDDKTLIAELTRQFGKASKTPFAFHRFAGGFYIRTGPLSGPWPDEEPVYDAKGNPQ